MIRTESTVALMIYVAHYFAILDHKGYVNKGELNLYSEGFYDVCIDE